MVYAHCYVDSDEIFLKNFWQIDLSVNANSTAQKPENQGKT